MKLSELFEENTKNVILKGIQTKDGFYYMYPNDDTNEIEFGYMYTEHEYEYDFDSSWDENIQYMIEKMMDIHGYPEEF